MGYCKTYENPKIHAVTGETIRPGGFASRTGRWNTAVLQRGQRF